MSNHLTVYIISDSLGETAQALAKAGICQFPNQKDWEIKRIPYVTSLDVLQDALKEAQANKGFVMFSLVNEELADYAAMFCFSKKMPYLDLMSQFLRQLGDYAQEEPLREAGLIRQLNKAYFNRIEAIEFAVKYDDGKDPRGFAKADLVLLGVSRTSKTPLSIYLANKELKVANLPLVPEAPLPKELMEIDPRRIIGLSHSPEELHRIRTERIKTMGLQSSASYAQMDRILMELEYADQVMKTLKCPIINVEHRSIEETAGLILDIMAEHRLHS